MSIPFDFVAHIGDYIYEHTPDDYNVREPENLRLVTGRETVTLQNYRMEEPESGISSMATYVTEAGSPGTNPAKSIPTSTTDH